MWAARGSSWLPLLIFTVLTALIKCNVNEIGGARNRRSIELSSAQKVINLHPHFSSKRHKINSNK